MSGADYTIGVRPGTRIDITLECPGPQVEIVHIVQRRQPPGLLGHDPCPDCGCRVDRHEGTDSDPDVWCEQTSHAYVPCPSLAGQP